MGAKLRWHIAGNIQLELEVPSSLIAKQNPKAGGADNFTWLVPVPQTASPCSQSDIKLTSANASVVIILLPSSSFPSTGHIMPKTAAPWKPVDLNGGDRSFQVWVCATLGFVAELAERQNPGIAERLYYIQTTRTLKARGRILLLGASKPCRSSSI